MSKINKLLLLVLLGICLISSTAFAGSITIKGSTTVLPIAQVCAEIFMDQNPSKNISVQGGGSGVGITSLLDGTCDIADASRPIKDKELKKAAEHGVDPKAHIVAMDGIAVIVHPSNKVKELTKDQIKAIYTGQISDWSQVGGGKGKIVVISRDSASGTFEAFNKLALEEEKVRPEALLQASNNAVVTTVAKTPQAIGYAGLGYVTKKVKAVKVDGVIPSKDTVISKEYPLSRPLYMYTNGNPKGITKEFIDFVLSKEGQKLVEENGFVSINK